MGGELQSNGNNIRLADSDILYIGTDGDGTLYHSGSNTFLSQNGTGELYLQGNTFVAIRSSDAGEMMGKFIRNGAVELYEDNYLKFRTGVTGDYGSVQLQNGKNSWYGVSCNGQTVFMSDGNDIGFYNDVDNEWILKGTRNSEVQLRHNGSTKFQTSSSGIIVTGKINFNGSGHTQGIELGAGQQLNMYHDTNDGYFDNNVGHFYIRNDGNSTSEQIRIQAKGGENSIICKPNDRVELYYDNSMKLWTQSWGAQCAGNFVPNGNNSYDLGASNERWRNIYTNDLNLSNEGGKNDVDGTWGNYTIQEGESELFLINNRNGKKYKFNLTEIS